MSKKICICGTDRSNEKPLVITITTCKKKHTQNDVNTSTSATQIDKNQNKTINRSESPHATKTLKPKLNESSNSIKGISFREFTSSANSTGYGQTDNYHEESNSEYFDVEDDENDDAVDHILYCEEDDVEHGGQGEFIGNKNSESSEEHIKKQKSKNKFKKKSKDEASKSERKNKSATAFPSSHNFEDEKNNFPSDINLKLPILPMRYHGPGCAMEIDILEKHDKSCRYRKLKNKERNPADDRVGSYEVIGRISYKTCQHLNVEDETKSPNQKLNELYSLFTVPKKDNSLDSRSSDNQLDFLTNYLKRQKVLDALARSSKSFPTTAGEKIKQKSKQGARKDSTIQVEELYVSGGKPNKSDEIKMLHKNKLKDKKWRYLFCPCLYTEKSYHSTPEAKPDFYSVTENKVFI